MKILVVSGFLGAGKTTFIQAMARRIQKNFVVYENEYAGVSIDAQRLAGSDINVWESTENCICCSGKVDFATAILTISGSLDPDYLIVEPTGVAKLSNIVENIQQILYERIMLLPPVTIIDGRAFSQQRLKYTEIMNDQVRAASTIVVSKVEAMLSSEIEELRERVAMLNLKAAFVAAPFDGLDAEWFETLLCDNSIAFLDASVIQGACVQRGTDGACDAGASGNAESLWADDTVDVGKLPSRLALADVELPTPTHLIALLDRLSSGEFGEVIRAKGSLPCGHEWLSFDYVGGHWTLAGDTPQKKGACVFIGKDLRHKDLRSLFEGRSAVRGVRIRSIKQQRHQRQKPQVPFSTAVSSKKAGIYSARA